MIFAYLLATFITANISASIIVKSYINLLSEVTKKGYKLDMDKLASFEKEKEEKSKMKNNLASIINSVLLFIPFVNIISSKIRTNKKNKEAFNDPGFKEAMIPLTEEEKEVVKTLKNDYQRAMFCSSASTREEDDIELVGFKDDTPIMVKNVRPSIKNNTINLVKYPMPHMSYTYDEVVKLNNSIKGMCKFGNADGRNVAIIGLKDDKSFDKIIFNQNGSGLNSGFEEYSIDEAKKHRYVVYPYSYEMEDNIDLTNSYNEIVENREMVLRRK